MRIHGGTALSAVVLLSVAGLTACSHDAGGQQAATTSSRVAYCVGVDKAHAEGSSVMVSFMRGSAILGQVGGAVTGPVSVGVTPGDVTVVVDGKNVATMTVGLGTTAYATSGTGCPSSP
jgi:hypothetical protein